MSGRVASAAGVALVLGAGAADAQPVPIGGRTPTTYVKRGAPQPAQLGDIARGAYQDRPVRTRGVLAPFEHPYWLLQDGAAHLLVIAAANTETSLRDLVGRQIEVDGLARELVDEQGTCQIQRRSYPRSYCEDPDLPPTPDLGGARRHWPRVSLTVWAALEVTPMDSGARRTSRSMIADLLDGAAPHERITVRGRFCGAALCGEPNTAAPSKDAWLLADHEVSVWVVGRPPRGKGWRLDPGYAGDASRWVEVTGRLERCGPVPCLRAARVALIPAPPPPDEP